MNHSRQLQNNRLIHEDHTSTMILLPMDTMGFPGLEPVGRTCRRRKILAEKVMRSITTHRGTTLHVRLNPVNPVMPPPIHQPATVPSRLFVKRMSAAVHTITLTREAPIDHTPVFLIVPLNPTDHTIRLNCLFLTIPLHPVDRNIRLNCQSTADPTPLLYIQVIPVYPTMHQDRVDTIPPFITTLTQPSPFEKPTTMDLTQQDMVKPNLRLFTTPLIQQATVEAMMPPTQQDTVKSNHRVFTTPLNQPVTNPRLFTTPLIQPVTVEATMAPTQDTAKPNLLLFTTPLIQLATAEATMPRPQPRTVDQTLLHIILRTQLERVTIPRI